LRKVPFWFLNLMLSPVANNWPTSNGGKKKRDCNVLTILVSGRTAPASQCARRILAQKAALEKCEPAGEFGENQRANMKDMGADVVDDIKALRDAMKDLEDPEKKEDFKRANALAMADATVVTAYAKPHTASELEDLLEDLEGQIYQLSKAKADGFPSRLFPAPPCLFSLDFVLKIN
jgi:hypothetical protein